MYHILASSAKPNSALVRSRSPRNPTHPGERRRTLRLPSEAPSSSISSLGGLEPSSWRSTLSKPSTGCRTPRDPQIAQHAVTALFRHGRRGRIRRHLRLAHGRRFLLHALARRPGCVHPQPAPGSLPRHRAHWPSGRHKTHRRFSGMTSPDTYRGAPAYLRLVGFCATAVIRPRGSFLRCLLRQFLFKPVPRSSGLDARLHMMALASSLVRLKRPGAGNAGAFLVLADS